jgi:ubiquitin-conjugating enzyme E2 M
MLSKLKNKPKISDGAGKEKVETAAIRIDRDLANLDGTSAKVTVPNPKDLKVLNVCVTPPDGIWLGGKFNFRLNFPDQYPHEPPKCTYLGETRLWHPNIEGDADKTEWGVCLNILRKDWKPVLGVRDILFGLEMMFFEPNLEDPLPGTARIAAQQLKDAPAAFQKKAGQWVKGNYAN